MVWTKWEITDEAPFQKVEFQNNFYKVNTTKY